MGVYVGLGVVYGWGNPLVRKRLRTRKQGQNRISFKQGETDTTPWETNRPGKSKRPLSDKQKGKGGALRPD